MADSIDQLRVSFVEETRDLINELEDVLLSLEVDSVDSETIDHIFRSVHTIKGSGGMLGFDKVLEVTHDLEDIYDKVRAGSIIFTNDLKEISLETIDVLKTLLANDEKLKDDDRIKFANLCRRIELFEIAVPEGADNLQNDTVLIKNQKKKFATFLIKISNKPKAFEKLYLLVEELSQLGDCLAFSKVGQLVNLNEFGENKKDADWILFLSTGEGELAIDEIFSLVIDSISLRITKITDGNLLAVSQANDLLVSAKNSIFKKSEEQLIEIIHQFSDQMIIEADETAKDRSQEKTSDDSSATNNVINSIRVSTEKIDQLMNLVSEMVTLQARLNLLAEESNNEDLINVAEKYGSFSKQLRDNAFNISLVPFGVTITRYKRLVHDLSEQLNKKVEFLTEGEDTVLDKKIIEQLSDPIMHILRNCVDHGIENVEDRLKANKPEAGKILMKIFHQSNNVIINISDDGKGLDLKRIKELGIERKLISADQQVTDNELINLVFLPGFSSAKIISNVSGRGVGLDVVKRNISDIRGNIEINTEEGKGTSFIIKLPLTLSIIDGLQVKIQNRDFIIPLIQVDKILTLSSLEQESMLSQVMTIEENRVPYFDLRADFEIEGEIPERREIVLVSYENEKVALIVDTVIGENQTVLKSLGKHYKKQDFFAGGTILGDGSVALVIDVNKIVTEFSKK
ncbi:MAG TPA: chemotaxis protein CheA [Prolixibacteraceae bacterium]|nr:chemotaxis protein CheA [Prolixibacteraceae bacterium]